MGNLSIYLKENILNTENYYLFNLLCKLQYKQLNKTIKKIEYKQTNKKYAIFGMSSNAGLHLINDDFIYCHSRAKRTGLVF